ncbi:hypothetical protein HZB88_05085 [archaeon]|nr:hypothetical protein [archaeon]
MKRMKRGQPLSKSTKKDNIASKTNPYQLHLLRFNIPLPILALLLLSISLILITAPILASAQEDEYYPVETAYEESAVEYEEEPVLSEVTFEDEIQEAGITSNNWILYPFDQLGEKLAYLFLFSEQSKIEHTLKLANERDYEIRVFNRKIALKSNKGDWKEVEKASKHLAKTNEEYNSLLIQADERFSTFQEEADEETIDKVYNQASNILNRHTINIIKTKQFVDRYSGQEGISEEALNQLYKVVEYEGLEEPEQEITEEAPAEQMPLQPQKPMQKEVLKPPLQSAKQPKASPQKPQQQAAQQPPLKQKTSTSGITTAAIASILNSGKGLLYSLFDPFF